MINLNGVFFDKSAEVLNANNRVFKYGDALFETIKVKNLTVYFIEDHYFRLMASMRMLRMEIPMSFTLDFFKSELLKTVQQNNLENARARFTVYRQDGGLYKPLTNQINYLIEVSPLLNTVVKEQYTIDLFKDYYVYSGLLSTIKTTNKLTNVLASIYASENNFDNCILINENKHVVEAINANIFIVKGSIIKTPPIIDGCVKGIARKKIIEIVSEMNAYTIEESVISPFDIQKADEVFISNVIIGIQPITSYKKAVYSTKVSKELTLEFNKLV
ncbi:MAG: aminotransferase class IV [Lutibacter sp.]|uniref:aminotransferase class IV n=1 Tax=Lutibacter sp. TaxID=1925666 RepID=UPI0019F0719B|nr:aminotransferase class IV [Lutibacter sp.]NOR28824.1 aminotransferase class IV [Lutibacter sp.]